MFTHKLKAHVASDLNFIVKGERLLGHRQSCIMKSGFVSETVLYTHVVTTGHEQEVILSVTYTAYLIAAIVMTLSVLEGHSPLQAFSSAIFRICVASCGPYASAALLVLSFVTSSAAR